MFSGLHKRLNHTIACNPGYWTFPDVNQKYPYGIKNTKIDLNKSLLKKFHIGLGTIDTKRGKNFRKTEEAEA